MKNNLLMAMVVVLIVGGASFFAGVKYQETKTVQQRGTFFRQFSGGQNNQLQGGNRLGGRPVTGEIISADDKSITVKMTDGSTKIVILSGKTIYNKTASGSKNDLKVGEKVGVFGTENSDGSVTAQNIQLNPQFREAPNRLPTN